jgi:hypothetical protein
VYGWGKKERTVGALFPPLDTVHAEPAPTNLVLLKDFTPKTITTFVLDFLCGLFGCPSGTEQRIRRNLVQFIGLESGTGSTKPFTNL